jgi:hypothetical protein
MVDHSEERDLPRNHKQLRKVGLDVIDIGSVTPPNLGIIMCALYGENYVRRCSLIFSRSYMHTWRIAYGKRPVPREMLEQMLFHAEDAKATADFFRVERKRFEARLERRLALRRFVARWLRFFVNGDYPIATTRHSLPLHHRRVA